MTSNKPGGMGPNPETPSVARKPEPKAKSGPDEVELAPIDQDAFFAAKSAYEQEQEEFFRLDR